MDLSSLAARLKVQSRSRITSSITW